MKYWDLEGEMLEKYGPKLMAYIEKCGGLENNGLDEFILLPTKNGEYAWFFDLNWEA